MTCFLCLCGTAIYYDSVHHEHVKCSGCERSYKVDKQTGKLHPVLEVEDFNLDHRNLFSEK